MSTSPAIEVTGLTKRFGDLVAVDEVSFDVARGSVFAFLGTNGAGKSTTIGCLTTTTRFDEGTARVAGLDVARGGMAVRRRIGVVFQQSLLDPALTARENLASRAAFYSGDRAANRVRIAELAELIQLEDFLDRPYGKLSGGQRRRVDIARALLHAPSILFLDEPTAGLDPSSRAVVWRTVNELSVRDGLTVFLTTHYMEETEQADHVCIIDRGRIIAADTPARLRAQHSASVLTVTSAAPQSLAGLAATAGLAPETDVTRVRIPVPDATTARTLLAAHGDDVVDFEFRHGTMDDVFLSLTGREAEDAA